MLSLLFTESLQHDFVGPVPAGAPLPNALHIGRAESRRLLGDPDGPWQHEGPLARFVTAWASGADPDHRAIHIRDWHDSRDPETRRHLDHFGDHCIRGTPGAEFVAPLRPLVETGRVVDSAIVSDFVGTDLEATLKPLVGDGNGVRAGIIGVWTDFKVQYLAYDLVTRLGLDEIAVCGALCASRSRIHHREALEHLSSNLGVVVLDSLPEFLSWLGIRGGTTPTVVRGRPVPTVRLPEGVTLDDEERRLAEYLFRDCRDVSLDPLSGGFSGSRVFRSRSTDKRGLREVPFVVKIDEHAKIARERVAVESVENLLGAASPRMSEYVDLETRGGIKYQFATMHAGEVQTLRSAFHAAPDPETVRSLFATVIERVLSRLYQAPHLDRLPLLGYYGFTPTNMAAAQTRCAGLAESVSGDILHIQGLAEGYPNPARLYRGVTGFEEPMEVACAMIHGDLNLANVLMDASGNTWLIDYFWTRVGHALQDIAKLENDLKFLLVPLADDESLRRAVAWEERLLTVDDLLSPPPALDATLASDPAIAKAHAAISTLRALGSSLLREAGVEGPVPTREYDLAQVRYSAHTLFFDEADDRQKRFALATTCRLAERLTARR
jgi:nicotinamidase-related amidase